MSASSDTSNDKPSTSITQIQPNDVICGRGRVTHIHPGNCAYRKLVDVNKALYATCLREEKLRISKSIVSAIREINGRFLEREDGQRQISTNLDEKDENGVPVKWRDIGDRRAIEKTSQALREGQPDLLRKLAKMTGGDVLSSLKCQVTSTEEKSPVSPVIGVEPESVSTSTTKQKVDLANDLSQSEFYFAVCEICYENTAFYCCPHCSIKACSLACCQAHITSSKQRLGQYIEEGDSKKRRKVFHNMLQVNT